MADHGTAIEWTQAPGYTPRVEVNERYCEAAVERLAQGVLDVEAAA